ncbi:MAG TPA: bifunctional diaminohydroxyphosphoribosylaminopyrimidine deaminase/5-amino-6-(5-phosphoribosylamino)uracil reductase RibD [Gammaproteobacteria bacterium]
MTRNQDAADERDRAYMARALQLAERGLYDTAPNPAVGCVLVADDEIVGEGWTAPAGGPHAERVALAAAGARAQGATAYVTLEPCSHYGRTGPCADALIAAGIVRVVCALVDPNPLVAGGGLGKLERAGIGVTVGVLGGPAEALNRGHVSRMSRRRPWVRAKVAASLDGRTALASGASRWITGDAARADVHRFRARSSVVLTGIGTVLADDPALTARLDDPEVRVLQPARAIVDSRFRTPLTAQTLKLPGTVLIFGTDANSDRARRLAEAGAKVETVAGSPRCDLNAVLARLAALEHNDVLLEAGPTLSGAFLTAGLIDELIVYLAPNVLGDRARGMFAIPPLTDLAERYLLEIDDVRKLGPDLRIIARPVTVARPAPET